MLNESEVLRYSSHLLLEQVGELGQIKLKEARVLIVGLGGLGSPAALYLAAAGVGSLVLADFDCLEISNLQRQIAYQSDQLGDQKTAAMKHRLAKLNPEIQLRSINIQMQPQQLSLEVMMADLVLDCTDNMESRQMINAACVKTNVPLIVGAASGLSGQLMFFDHRQADSACYHCLFADVEQPLNCTNAGVLGPVVGTIGALQALLAIKHIVGLPCALNNKIKCFDGNTLEWQTFSIEKDPKCSVCGDIDEFNR